MAHQLSVQIDWNGDGDFSDANEDITAYVKDARITRSMSDSLSRVADIGTLNIVVHNEDRRFSPAYTGGPLYGLLKPGLPVRVRLIDGVTTYPLFTGYTRSFTPTSGQYGERTAEIECGDALMLMQNHLLSLPLQRGRTMDYLMKLIVAHTFRGGLATGRFDFSAQPADGDTFAVNGVVYRFKNTIAQANGVKIGATLEETVDNAAAAVNGGAGAGTAYANNTTRPAGAVAVPNRTYYRELLQDETLRYYRLGEVGTSIIKDSGLNKLNGTLNFTPGFIPGAMPNDPDGSMGFDGVGYYASLPTLQIDNRDFYIECWIYPYNFNIPAAQTFFSAHSAQAPGQSVHMRVLSNGTLYVGFWGDDFQTAPGVVPFGAWTHVALNYDAVNDVLTLFVNGVPYTTSSVGPFLGATPLIELGRAFGGTEYWNGAIDEFTIGWKTLSAERIAVHYAARNIAPGITIQANARGAWGNSITLAESSSAITVTGATLTGGTDGPAGLLSAETGVAAIDVAGDQWASDGTSALDAATEVMETERGLLWVDKNGVIQAKNRNYEYTRSAQANAINISSEHNALGMGQELDMLFNRIVVSFTPRGTLANGIIAKSSGVIAVPGKWGNTRWSPAGDFDPTKYENPDGGLLVTRLPFVDREGGGRLIGAESVNLPLRPGVDYTIGDTPDETNYTNTSHLTFSIAVTGSGVEVSMRNTALGTLYVKGLTIWGIGLVAYDKQEAIAEDAASMDAYGRRTLSVEQPLSGDIEFAQALARYLLNRYKQPTQRVERIGFDDAVTKIGGVSLLGLDVGDVIRLTDYQTGITNQRYMVAGVEISRLLPGVEKQIDISLDIRRIDDTQFALFGEGSLSLMNGSNNFSL